MHYQPMSRLHTIITLPLATHLENLGDGLAHILLELPLMRFIEPRVSEEMKDYFTALTTGR